jgi:hypothetical protein
MLRLKLKKENYLIIIKVFYLFIILITFCLLYANFKNKF